MAEWSPLRRRMIEDRTVRNRSPARSDPMSTRWRSSADINRSPDRLGLEDVRTLAPDEFIRRFLLHTLPGGLHRIRHYGFLANGHRVEKLALCRSLLAVPEPPADHDDTAPTDSAARPRQHDCCPGCGSTSVTRTVLPRLQPC